MADSILRTTDPETVDLINNPDNPARKKAADQWYKMDEAGKRQLSALRDAAKKRKAVLVSSSANPCEGSIGTANCKK